MTLKEQLIDALVRNTVMTNAQCDKVLERSSHNTRQALLKDGAISYMPYGPKRRSVVFLTNAALTARGLPPRERPFGPQSLHALLGRSAFALNRHPERQQVTNAVLEQAIKTGLGGGAHVLDRQEKRQVVWRVIVPASTTTVKAILKKLHRVVGAAKKTPLKAWLEARTYGLAVMLSNEHKAAALGRAVSRKSRKYPPLNSQVSILIEYADF